MQLTTANLEKYTWLFSASLGLMVREHECGGGRCDVELDSYTNQGSENDPRWDSDYFNSADTLDALVKSEGNYLTATRDWVHGDKVNFF